MTIRYDDPAREITISVRDLVEHLEVSGHLTLDVVQRTATRAALGRQVHQDWQREREAQDDAFTAEVALKRRLVVDGWTITVQGRVDGLVEIGGRAVVEEVKSTALDGGRLFATDLSSWPEYVSQVEIYLWMLAGEQRPDPVGRLVLVSLADGARHVLGVALDAAAVGRRVRERLARLVKEREARLAWLEARRAAVVPTPFDAWRAGQEDIVREVMGALEAGRPALVQAPTGLGKTAAVAHAVLAVALATDRQVFWATARTTQQRAAEDTFDRIAARGLPLRVVTLRAKEKACLNDVVACRPDLCRFAEHYHDKLHERDVVPRLVSAGRASPQVVRDTALDAEVCPFQLALDASDHVDVVIGDYNYAFDPDVRLRRHFGDTAADWIVVVDEAHQLVERARGYGSPAVEAAVAREAARVLDGAGPDLEPFADLAREVEYRVLEAIELADGPSRGDEGVTTLSRELWRDLADRIDELGLDYALLTADRPVVAAGARDPWREVAWAVLRFVRVLEASGEESVHLVDRRRGAERVRVLCLDPSSWLGPHLARLGGFVGMSATLAPVAFHRDLLGLSAELAFVDVPSPFPPENRRVVLAPRVSTAFRDRAAHAERTAALMTRCIEATPGNVAAYFPSFAMLRDITSRWALPDRDLLAQEPQMDEDLRRAWLDRMASSERPVVLAAVLGGIFAEGIDLPEGALSCVLVAGPALPPVGLERDLLRQAYEERYGEGFAYASLVPGMTRVVQAAGRLVRRPEDRGVVVLVGRRFRWRDHAALLPADWQVDVPDDPAEAVREFFAS